jgi:hypothetical protein
MQSVYPDNYTGLNVLPGCKMNDATENRIQLNKRKQLLYRNVHIKAGTADRNAS